MVLIRPRLNDFYNLSFNQSMVDFVIPFLDEDIPLYVDPFLLWKSPSQQDNSLHTTIINCFNYLVQLANNNKEIEAIETLIKCSECNEVGLGFSEKREGLKIGEKIAKSIIKSFKEINHIRQNGFVHFEELQLYIDGIGPDRISDITCNYLKSFLIDYTIDKCHKHNIPLTKINEIEIYDIKINKIMIEKNVELPINPENNNAILFVPIRWLRKDTWINYEDYFKSFFLENVHKNNEKIPIKIEILNYNRRNYDLVKTYIEKKERKQEDCRNDPLFEQIPVFSAKRKLNSTIRLPYGKIQNADRKYEDYLYQLLASLLYPDLDFAKYHSRTDSGVLIRDLIFYNNRTVNFLEDIYKDFNCRQIVIEIKNVEYVNGENINQLNRYLTDQFGKFGIIATRNKIPRKIIKNTIDLWSGQRRCIITLNDEDLKLMVSVFESKQRKPIEVIKKKFIEFTQECPS